MVSTTSHYGHRKIINMIKIDSQISYSKLTNALKKEIVTVIFEKKNGTTREMNCTLMEDYVSLVKNPTYSEKESDTISVWDVEVSGWRSFRLDSVKYLSVEDYK